jgi:acetyltransferase-like isoleucine patch superfamily enzyme
VDAKGDGNEGITIGSGVYIGRGSIVYCKGGDIILCDRVSISSSCTVFASNKLTIKEDTIIGAYSYLLSGGEYDYADVTTRFSEQSGMETKGELVVGEKPIEANRLAVGVPAKVIKTLDAFPDKAD